MFGRMNYDAIRPLFGGRLTQSQVNGIETILAATERLPRPYRAYLLATAKHETADRMQPVRETLAETDEQAVNRLERAWKAGRLPWVSVPYWRFDASGKAWFGRGHVQLTHRENYAKAAQKIGVDLLGNPSRALNPEVSALILVRGATEGWFTGRKLSDYLDQGPPDYLNARRVINGTDRAALIKRYAQAFEAALGGARGPSPRLWQRLWRYIQKTMMEKLRV